MARSAFAISASPSLETALVAFDTNVLLLPYKATQHSLEAIAKVYRKLADDGRVVIPQQVATEYERNRTKHLADLYHSLNSLVPANAARRDYPLLADLEPWKELGAKLEAVNKTLDEARGLLRSVRHQVKQWSRTDPVHEVYSSVFGDLVLRTSGLGPDAFAKTRDERYKAKLPPGYKDASKDDGGGGDLEIWLTLIEAAKAARRDLVFITGDEKADWYQQAASEAFHVRPELLREFRDRSGQELDLMKLSDLLDAMKAPAAAVSDIRSKEASGGSSTQILTEQDLLPALDEFVQHRHPDSDVALDYRIGDFRVDAVAVESNGTEHAFELRLLGHTPSVPRALLNQCRALNTDFATVTLILASTNRIALLDAAEMSASGCAPIPTTWTV